MTVLALLTIHVLPGRAKQGLERGTISDGSRTQPAEWDSSLNASNLSDDPRASIDVVPGD